jgi:CubicO group peptidase (beta-lactamase class C family)
MAAGELIKRTTGMSWEDFITKRILQKLDMDNSSASLDEVQDKSNYATSHVSSSDIRYITSTA